MSAQGPMSAQGKGMPKGRRSPELDVFLRCWAFALLGYRRVIRMLFARTMEPRLHASVFLETHLPVEAAGGPVGAVDRRDQHFTA